MKVNLEISSKGKPKQTLKGEIEFNEKEREFLMVAIAAIGTLGKLDQVATIQWGRDLFRRFNEAK